MGMEAARVWVIFAGILLTVWSSGLSVTADKDQGHPLIAERINPTLNQDSNYSKVSCTFVRDTCGWRNVGGDNYPLQWTRHRKRYMQLSMAKAGVDLKGRLASPWLPALKNWRCQLVFQYYITIKRDKNCQLSLITQTSAAGTEQTVWFTQESSGLRSFSYPVVLNISCSVERYRLVFEGWRCCDVRFFNEIRIKHVEFIVIPENEEPVTSEGPSVMEISTVQEMSTWEYTTPESVSSNPDGRGVTDPRATDRDDEESMSDGRGVTDPRATDRDDEESMPDGQGVTDPRARDTDDEESMPDGQGVTDPRATDRDDEEFMQDGSGVIDPRATDRDEEESMTDGRGVTDPRATDRDDEESMPDERGVTDPRATERDDEESMPDGRGVTDPRATDRDDEESMPDRQGVTDARARDRVEEEPKPGGADASLADIFIADVIVIAVVVVVIVIFAFIIVIIKCSRRVV